MRKCFKQHTFWLATSSQSDFITGIRITLLLDGLFSVLDWPLSDLLSSNSQFFGLPLLDLCSDCFGIVDFCLVKTNLNTQKRVNLNEKKKKKLSWTLTEKTRKYKILARTKHERTSLNFHTSGAKQRTRSHRIQSTNRYRIDKYQSCPSWNRLVCKSHHPLQQTSKCSLNSKTSLVSQKRTKLSNSTTLLCFYKICNSTQYNSWQ